MRFFVALLFLFPASLKAEWSLVREEEGIKTFRESDPQGPLLAFRGEVTIGAPIARVTAVLYDPELRKQWVDSVVETRVIKRYSEFKTLEYLHTSVPWPFRDRDFVYEVHVTAEQTPRHLEISLKSVEDETAPDVDGLVRGKILNALYDLKEVPGDPAGTRVRIEISVDPGGSIPAWAVNLTQKRWPQNTLSGMRRMALREDFVVSKGIQGFFRQGAE